MVPPPTTRTEVPRETSPYNLLQEQLRDEPWRLLVACIMLNQTTAVQVKKVIWKFFEKWGNWEWFLFQAHCQYPGNCQYVHEAQEIKDLLRPLGFMNRRFDRLVRMSIDFANLRPDKNLSVDVRELHGVGKYAADSYNLFARGYFVEDVKDKELRNYVCWLKKRSPGHRDRALAG